MDDGSLLVSGHRACEAPAGLAPHAARVTIGERGTTPQAAVPPQLLPVQHQFEHLALAMLHQGYVLPVALCEVRLIEHMLGV